MAISSTTDHPIDFGSCAAGTCEFARGDVHRLHSVWSRGGKGRRNPHMQAADRRAMKELVHDKQSNFSRVAVPRVAGKAPTDLRLLRWPGDIEAAYAKERVSRGLVKQFGAPLQAALEAVRRDAIVGVTHDGDQGVEHED